MYLFQMCNGKIIMTYYRPAIKAYKKWPMEHDYFTIIYFLANFLTLLCALFHSSQTRLVSSFYSIVLITLLSLRNLYLNLINALNPLNLSSSWKLPPFKMRNGKDSLIFDIIQLKRWFINESLSRFLVFEGNTRMFLPIFLYFYMSRYFLQINLKHNLRKGQELFDVTFDWRSEKILLCSTIVIKNRKNYE